MTICPCCKGDGFLLVVDANWPGDQSHHICFYCEGSGCVATELEEEDENQQ
jgi:hypothetical protein